MPGTARAKKGNKELYAFDARMREQFGVVCGVDEAGRGPPRGPGFCGAKRTATQNTGPHSGPRPASSTPQTTPNRSRIRASKA